MLHGKIISIGKKNSHWALQIDGHNLKFNDYKSMGEFLIRVVEKGKDPKKLALLKEDIKHILK